MYDVWLFGKTNGREESKDQRKKTKQQGLNWLFLLSVLYWQPLPPFFSFFLFLSDSVLTIYDRQYMKIKLHAARSALSLPCL